MAVTSCWDGPVDLATSTGTSTAGQAGQATRSQLEPGGAVRRHRLSAVERRGMPLLTHCAVPSTTAPVDRPLNGHATDLGFKTNAQTPKFRPHARRTSWPCCGGSSAPGSMRSAPTSTSGAMPWSMCRTLLRWPSRLARRGGCGSQPNRRAMLLYDLIVLLFVGGGFHGCGLCSERSFVLVHVSARSIQHHQCICRAWWYGMCDEVFGIGACIGAASGLKQPA